MKIKFTVFLLLLITPTLASAQFTQQWVSTYNGPANGEDVALAIAVDAAGNVYVTGYSDGGVTGFDYATVKYDPTGVQLWVQRYDGTGGDDVASAIAVDAAGNVYVTGYSLGAGTGFDYATVSYDTNGVLRWVQRYDGPASGDDFATGLVLDAAANVYVTGGSLGLTADLDYATIAYDTNGVPLWAAAARYDNGAGDDVPNALAVDGAGNVYVTGESMGVGTGLDYATVAYDPTGAQLWVMRYNGPGNGDDVAQAIVVDASSNVYITGYSRGGLATANDYATLAYNSAGALLWEQRYNGPGNSDDFANSIALDPAAGAIYVTGQSVGVGTDFDFATVSYDALSGTQNWVQRYDGPGSGRDDAYSVVVDTFGEVYVTGYSLGLGTGLDYATIAYDFTGAQLWVARFDGPNSLDDAALAVTADGASNVYITGFTTSLATGRDYGTIRYSQP